MNKQVYILLATYNGEKYLFEQLESIICQTYTNWQLIVHDDNSRDNTVSIIKRYEKEYPNKIIFLDDNVSCGGAKENFTYLLNSIDDNFDYVMFCDQDDIWLDNKIEVTLQKMIEVENNHINKPILIHTDLKVVDEKLNIISDSMFKYQKLNIIYQNSIYDLAIQNIITGCTMMINAKLAFLSKYIPQDAVMHDWWISLITLKNQGKIAFLKESTILYRQHSSNEVGSKKINIFYYIKRLSSIQDIFYDYALIWKQIVTLKIPISYMQFIYKKTFFILRKII